MCTAFSYCRDHQQRLRAGAGYAAAASGGFGSGPWVLRPKRLQWLTNIRAGFKIAAFFVVEPAAALAHRSVTPAKAGAGLSIAPACEKPNPGLRRDDGVRVISRKEFNHMRPASRHTAIFQHSISICGHEARAGTSPPFFTLRPRAITRGQTSAEPGQPP
jgi:hypothetical protein